MPVRPVPQMTCIEARLAPVIFRNNPIPTLGSGFTLREKTRFGINIFGHTLCNYYETMPLSYPFRR